MAKLANNSELVERSFSPGTEESSCGTGTGTSSRAALATISKGEELQDGSILVKNEEARRSVRVLVWFCLVLFLSYLFLFSLVYFDFPFNFEVFYSSLCTSNCLKKRTKKKKKKKKSDRHCLYFQEGFNEDR